LIKAEWPARMQRLRQGKLAALTPADSELWLDGGHNPDGGRAVAAALADLEERVPRPLVVIAGMLVTKDHANFFRHFSGLAMRLYAIPIPHQEKSLSPAEIVKTAQEIGIPAEPAAGIEDALARVATLSLDPPPRILIAGSLYLAGEILKENGTPPE
jgi:dihydrofolate synthase/folylpolyglutamate synthase